jgi:hypothetical protein
MREHRQEQDRRQRNPGPEKMEPQQREGVKNTEKRVVEEQGEG